MKNQLKKSLSLIMAVLMVLSCWVWIAPTQAEAADKAKEKYTVNIYYDIPSDGSGNNCPENSIFTIHFKPSNGTGSQGWKTFERGDLGGVEGKTNQCQTFEVDGWPTSIRIQLTNSAGGKVNVVFNRIEINGRAVIPNGPYTFTAGNTKEFTPSADGTSGVVYDADDKTNTTVTGWNWPKPTIAGIRTDENPSPVSLPVNKIGGADTSVNAIFPEFVDQYGVAWTKTNGFGTLDNPNAGEIEYEYFISNSPSGGEQLYKDTNDENMLYVSSTNLNTATATASSMLQTVLQMRDDNTLDETYLVLKMTYKDTANSSEATTQNGAKINLVYPRYDWLFDGDGAVGGDPQTTITMSGDGVEADPTTYSEKIYGSFDKPEYKYYGQSIENWYPLDAAKELHTFYGFWSKPQPIDYITANAQLSELLFNATPNAYEMFFIEPMSTVDIQNFAAKTDDGYEKLAFNNSYELITENSTDKVAVYTFLKQQVNEETVKYFYDAGVRWDVTNKDLFVTNGDNEWHSWWGKSDLSVKFYDMDGQFLGDYSLKYGDTEAASVFGSEGWPTPTKETYVSGAYTYSNFTGKWVHIDGEIVDSQGYTFRHDLILTPVYEKVSFDKEYLITFKDSYKLSLTGYNDIVYQYRDIANLPAEDKVTKLFADDEFEYDFVGWTKKAPSTNDGYNHHVILEDADFDVNGVEINLVSDFTVCEDVTYYPVFRRKAATHEVTFSFVNDKGENAVLTKEFEYGERITPPEEIPTEYVLDGYGFDLVGWSINGEDINNFYSQYCKPGLVYVARYSEGEARPFTVTFKYRDKNGAEKTQDIYVNNGDKISQEAVNNIIAEVAKEYDDGKYLYSYDGRWKQSEVTYAASASVNTSGTYPLIASFAPTSNVTFTAVYEDPKPFYTATYVDGANTESFRVVTGTELPFWTVETTGEDGTTTEAEYVPSREDTIEGEYEFLGWYDQKQTEEQIQNGETAGNPYSPGETAVTSNVTLYPQFGFKLFEYTYTFYNYNGTEVLAEGTFHYGDSIGELKVDAETAAAAAATGKPADNTYTYKFIGWDRVVPSFCEGTNLSFIAQYQAQYIYYDIEWYNSALDADNNWVIVGEKLATSSYIYGDKLRAPSLTLEIPEYSDENQSYVLEGWYYKDENGNEQKFQRNMLLNESMLTDGKVKMYPKYALTARLYDVTVVVEGADYTVTVAAGATLTDLISEPASGYYNETQHYGFDEWVTKAADGEETAYDLSEEVHSDLTLYATYSYQNHEYSANEVVTAPTYPVAELKDADGNILVEAASGEGLRAYWCECNKEKTYDDDKTNGINDALNVIPALTDSVAPESTAYIGTNKQLSIADAAAAEKIYVNPNTDLIITTSDKGDVNAEFNAAGTGIGVTSVALQIVEAATLNATTEDEIAALTDWQTMYDWPATQLALIEYYGTWAKVPDMYKNYNANASGKLSSYNLDNGTEYIAYFKIVDKAGNTSYMRSVKFFYDSIKPSMSIYGDGNKVTGVFCEGVTIEVFGETNYVVTANGTPISKNEGLYHITEDGTYQLVVTDAAGNKSTAFFSVAPHNTRLTEIAATCFIDGYTTQKCLNCGTEFGVIEEIPCTGHLDLKVETTEATCTTNGYDTMTCSACGLEEVVDVKQDEEGNWGDLYPALGHNWSEWRVTKAATCSTEGLQRRTCSRCGEAEEENIATDSTAHNFYRAVVVRPTCTDAGRRTQTCRLCGYIDVLAQGTDATADNYNADYAAKGHDYTVEKVITEATCHSAGSKATYCATCGVKQENSDAVIPATGLHVYVLNEDLSYEATGEAEGLAHYECSNEGCTAYYTNKIDKLAKYTIKFMSEDGSAVLKEIEKVVGETVDLTVDAVTEPTKANSTDGKTRYEFAGWYTKDADGNYSSKPYAFPATVTGDVTVYAKFTDKAIYYTVQFKAAKSYNGDAEMFKVLMGAIGDTRMPAEIPVIASDKMNDYEFLYWYNIDGKYNGEVSGDATYTAKFDAIAKAYDVIFMCEDAAVGKITVTAGGTATYAGETPTKASDADYHYIFTGWDGSLENITSKTTVYAEFEAVEHSFDVGEVTQQASCTLPELTKYTCGDCGYEKTVETKAALNHPTEYLETTYDEESGKNVTTCTLCGTVVKEEAASYTIVFENWDGGRLDTLTANVNADFKYAADAAAEKATRKADEMYYYTFAGWAVKGTTDIVTTFVATENVTYVAQYTTTDRTYTVTFAKADNSAVISFTGIAYGSTIATMGTEDTSDDIDVATYLFNAELFGIPAATSAGHSAYDKWDTDFADGVKKDMLVRPVYKLIAHNYDKNSDGQITEADAEMTQATCQHSGGYKYSCADCGYFYVDGIVDKLDHTWVEYKVDEPTYEAAGKSYQRCAVCGETREEVIPALTRIVINVTIKDTAGVAYEGAKVTITHAVSEKSYGPNQTNKEGVATFYVDEAGEYIVKVTGIEGHDGGLTGSITVDDSGKITKNELPQIQGDHSGACSCACHRTNFWGMLFRFFHKIIALIAGDYICCDCPDHRYFE